MAKIRNRVAWRTMLGAAAVMLALAGTQPIVPAAHAAPYVMKFGIATINESQHEFLKMYKTALEKASGGRIEVQIFPNSELGAIPREIEGVQFNSIQAFMGPVDFFVGIDLRYGVFSAPMLFRDDANTIATIHDPALEKKMLNIAEGKGLVGIATLDVGASNYGAKDAILRLSDFKGKKLRINGTALERAKMSLLGATGVAMPLSEVVPALDQGVIDGTISATSIFVSFKMINLVKVVTVTNDTMIISIAMVSKRWLDGLPPDLRQMVIDTGRTVQSKAQRWEVQFAANLDKKWAAMGGEIHKLPPEDLAKMKTLLTPVGDEVTKSQPALHAMLQEVRAVAAKH
ncbi:MAG TPA: TRAP transporter substrate-binding protein [Stellaceae bacterium]|nr:TRAP transporter substrate-binding protein [Stellaceae bacterium]